MIKRKAVDMLALEALRVQLLLTAPVRLVQSLVLT